MTTKTKNLITFCVMAALLLTISVLIITRCTQAPDVVTETKEIITYDSVIHHDTILKPQPYTVIKEVPVDRWIMNHDCDTMQLLLKYGYFQEKLYDQLFRDDTNALIRYKYSVFMNEAQGGMLTFQNRRPWKKEYINQVIQKAPVRFHLGAGVGFNPVAKRVYISPGFVISVRDICVLGADYDIMTGTIQGRLYWGVSFKKRR